MNLSKIDRGSTPGVLSSLTYRSRAVEPMSPRALRELESTAQARNGSEGLTGFLIYDDGHFFQWLEGPAESLSRVWHSVQSDVRHTDIADVTIGLTHARLFEGWDLRLAIRGEKPRAQMRAAQLLSLVGKVAPVAADPARLSGAGVKASAGTPVIPFLPVLVEALVVPQIFSRHGNLRRFLPPVSPVAARLSRLLLSNDTTAATAVLARLHEGAGSLSALCATVIEPAARNIGDLWLADHCSQLAMTMAMCRLNGIVRKLNSAAVPLTVGLPVVLVAPQPGEGHLLGAGLDAELLWQAGWDTHSEFPETDGALQTLVAETWFDVLDLSLSPALCRHDSLPEMAATICGARTASMNPALTVVVGGRAFFEQAEGSASVGADASSTSALQIVLTATAARRATLVKLAGETAHADSADSVARVLGATSRPGS